MLSVQIFFCTPVVKESISYRTTANRLIYDSKPLEKFGRDKTIGYCVFTSSALVKIPIFRLLIAHCNSIQL